MSTVIPYPTGDVETIIEMGIGQQSRSGVWDTSTWDYAVWAVTDTSLGDWVDVTCDVEEISVTSGASAPDGLVTHIDATTGAVTLIGEQWNPWASTWNNILGPGVPVRGRWRRPASPANPWLPWFAGSTDKWPYDRTNKRVAVPFADGTSWLGNYTLQPQAAAVGGHETVSARINRVLDAARWPAGNRDVAAGGVTCQPTMLDGAAWDQIVVAAETNIGIVWLTRAGKVAFRPVAQAGQWTPNPSPYRLTDTDTAAQPQDVCVVNFTRADPVAVRNDVTVSHVPPPVDGAPDPPTTHLTDDASISRYGPHTYSRTDLIHDTDAWSDTVAGVILQSGAWPAQHPETADLDIRADGRVAELLLSTEVAQTVDVLDSGGLFRCVVVGYTVDMTRTQLTGTIVLDDITAWIAGRWDTAKWDAERWGI